jgi:Tfp pilus assembly protein FimT
MLEVFRPPFLAPLLHFEKIEMRTVTLLRHHRPAGFTLLEALVAAFVVSVVMTFSLPSLIDGLRSHSMTSGVRTTASYLRVVRGTAIARGTQSRLVVINGNQLATEVSASGSWTRVGRGVTLDGGVSIVQVTNGPITFEREGTISAPAAVTLENPRGDRRQVAVTMLGAVEVP